MGGGKSRNEEIRRFVGKLVEKQTLIIYECLTSTWVHVTMFPKSSRICRKTPRSGGDVGGGRVATVVGRQRLVRELLCFNSVAPLIVWPVETPHLAGFP